ncbi:PEP-utilizing enzyme [Georgenia sp. MJ170]|uniref:PEP-utilizing enzyme n=1 Tax=Georgenia sunbinii TaxID=3117728 RepID=UPI002F2631B8
MTAVVPDSTAPSPTAAGSVTITGEAASPGVATGPVRLVRGPGDFPQVERGDVLVCRHTDPAWTPLFTIASAVVTERGGVLSHAAIVAREVGIPAVLSVPRATELLLPSSAVTVDGNTGHISL